jgi:hypothetical protein
MLWEFVGICGDVTANRMQTVRVVVSARKTLEAVPSIDSLTHQGLAI